MEKEVIEIKEVERSYRQRMKDFFVSAKNRINDTKLLISENRNIRIGRREYEDSRLEAENYNKLDLVKKFGYTAIHGIFACSFVSIAIISAVALTPVNIFLALPLTAITFGASWFCKNNFNENKIELKNMLEKYSEKNQKDEKDLIAEKENKKAKKEVKKAHKQLAKEAKKTEKKELRKAKKIEKETKKEAKIVENKVRPSLFERIVKKFKNPNDVYEELDMPELDNNSLEIPQTSKLKESKINNRVLAIPQPSKLKGAKVDGITINPITKKVTVKDLKIKYRKGLGVYEVVLPKNNEMVNKLSKQIIAQYEKVGSYETEENKVIVLKK